MDPIFFPILWSFVGNKANDRKKMGSKEKWRKVKILCILERYEQIERVWLRPTFVTSPYDYH